MHGRGGDLDCPSLGGSVCGVLIASSGGWQLGIALGVVVIAVAAVIVITIVVLGIQDREAGEGRRGRRRGRAAADGRALRHRPDQRLGRPDPPLGARAAEGGGREMSATTYWEIALLIGLVAALVVAVLLALLISAVRSIEKSVDGLLETAGKVAANTANIPQLEATAPVLALIVDEAVIQDGYMNALTDGFGDAA